MPRSLTKKFIRMASQDEAGPLLAALGEGFDPRDFHIEGDLLPLRCAMYGSIECLLAMLGARPDLAEQIASIADGNGERCVDWASAWADARQVRELAALAPLASRESGPEGHWPLARALACARWDAAAFLLELAPGSAKLSSSMGRGALHLAAEPGWEFQALESAPVWMPPPPELPRRLVELGASPSLRNEKGYTALSRSITSGNLPVFLACLDALDSESLEAVLAVGSTGFGAVHEAAWNGRSEMIEALAARGACLDVSNEKGLDALHLAIRRGSKPVAESLLRLGMKFDASPVRSTSCACSAMATDDPESWLAWLAERGADLNLRDDHGSHWAEFAWERLPMARARALWESLGEKAPLRSSRSMLGPLERAARSETEAVEKTLHLLSTGLLPARVRSSASSGCARTQLDALTVETSRQRSFGAVKRLELGPMWDTEQDPILFSEPLRPLPPFHQDWPSDDDFSFAPSPKGSKPLGGGRRRPSLLAYCTRQGTCALIEALIDWDAHHGFWRPADYLCAWREALAADASLPILKRLLRSVSELGLDLWGSSETRSAIDKLGPAKARSLGAPSASCGAALRSLAESGPFEALSALLLSAAPFSGGTHFAGPLKYAVDNHEALESPWKAACRSRHAGAIKALLPKNSPLPGLSCAHAAMACAQADEPELVLWVARRAGELALGADFDSPWGREPACALALWDEQIRHEGRVEWARCRGSWPALALDKAGSGHPALFSHPGLPEGSISAPLLCTLVRADQCDAAAALVGMGVPAPQSFVALSQAIGACALAATGIGKGNELLESLRGLVDAICAREDFRKILNNSGGDSILALVPDPALFESLLAAGAHPGSGSENAFVKLCERFAGRLSPAFSERLARASREAFPEHPLAVAAALASMRPHRSSDFTKLTPTAASLLRVTRAVRGVDPQAWADAFSRQACPVANAIAAGSVELGIALGKEAPSSYPALAGSSWGALWLGSRLPLLSQALALHDEDSRAALASFDLELARLSNMGVGLNFDPALEASKTADALDRPGGHGKAILWLLARGWRPDGSIDQVNWGWPLSVRVRRAFAEAYPDAELPAQAPLLCAVIAREHDQDVLLELCLEWIRAKLPAGLASPSGPILPFHAILLPQDASRLEACLLDASLLRPGSDAPRALARVRL